MPEIIFPLGLVPIDWFVSYKPTWLGPAIMIVGAVLLILSYLSYQETNTVQLGIVVGMATFAALPWAVQNSRLIVILLSFTGSWFQGVGTVRGYLKLKYYLGKIPGVIEHIRSKISSQTGATDASVGGTTGDGGTLRSIAETALWRLVFQLLGLLAVITSIWIGVGLTTLGPLTIPSLTTDVVIVWTLMTTFGALLGLGWRFWSVRGSFPATALLGVICIAAGAEVYNFRALETEVAVFLATKAMYVFGFLGAIALFVLANRSPESYTTTHHSMRDD